jgi:hypothetical protein
MLKLQRKKYQIDFLAQIYVFFLPGMRFNERTTQKKWKFMLSFFHSSSLHVDNTPELFKQLLYSFNFFVFCFHKRKKSLCLSAMLFINIIKQYIVVRWEKHEFSLLNETWKSCEPQEVCGKSSGTSKEFLCFVHLWICSWVYLFSLFVCFIPFSSNSSFNTLLCSNIQKLKQWKLLNKSFDNGEPPSNTFSRHLSSNLNLHSMKRDNLLRFPESASLCLIFQLNLKAKFNNIRLQ